MDSIAKDKDKVKREIVITSKREINNSVFDVILDMFSDFDINDELEGISMLYKYILAQRKDRSKLILGKNRLF